MDVTISGPAGGATFSTHGAEPQSYRGPDGHELLWQAGEVWPKHAPVLFPIVGRVPDDEISVDGVTYPMRQHGFARDLEWEVASRGRASVTFLLRDSDATRERFPFAFELRATYVVDDAGLSTTYAVTNTGDVDLPHSIGSHPGLRWPLDDGVAQTAHTIVFDEPEPAPIRRVVKTLLTPVEHPTPISGRTLALDPALFVDDAVVMPRPASRGLVYASGEHAVRLTWDDAFDTLVVWSPPAGGELLCIEPCAGSATPAGFTGDFRTKPGVVSLAPGATRTLGYRLDPR